ncbi:MAG: ribosome maturation factor RimM [Bacteroidales bacterium]
MQKSANILLPVAKVLKSFGTKGEFIIRYYPETQEDINEEKPVFIYYDGLPVPFFVESIKEKGADLALVKLGGIYTESLADEIAGEFIYIEKRVKKSRTHIESPDDLIGFTVEDTGGTLLGRISMFYNYPGNPCLGIITDEINYGKSTTSQEQLLPFHEEFIIDIDLERSVITVQLPKGLLSL